MKNEARPAQSHIPPFDRIGPYQVQDLIGSGGMAEVYRGFDTNLQRPVAIKILHGAIAAQPGFAERFQQEARLLARLRHPHIVQVYDLGEQAGSLYMVQEFLPGPTLEQRIEKLSRHGNRLERAEITQIATQLASALDAAHAAGIIHRDVKPGNVMWNAGGNLVLTDFGIAKASLGNTNQTQAGMVVGTPAYLSPEQAQGLALTPASDIYSLGVLLYELISGVPPFKGDTPIALALRHIQDPPPLLRGARPDLPQAVEATIQRALAKNPADRFASAGQLASELERAWASQPISPASAPGPDLHSQATRHWQPHPPAQQHERPPDRRQPLSIEQQQAVSRPRSMLPLLVILLIGLLVGGAFLALQGSRAQSPASGDQPTSDAALPPTAPPEATPELEVTPEPAATPEPVVNPTAPPATEPPIPILEPPTLPLPELATPIPLPALSPPSIPAGSLEQLRLLIQQGLGDGRVQEKAGGELLKKLDETERELNKQNPKKAADKLRELQKKLVEGAHERRIDSALTQQALAIINDIAQTHGLRLDSGDEDEGND